MVYATAARGFKAGGFNAASPAGQRSVRRGAQLELRSGREDALVRRPAVGERRRVLSDVGRHAGERPESVRAGAVLHRQRRQRDEQGRRGRAQRAAVRRAATSSAGSATRTRASTTAASRAASPWAASALSNTPNYTADFGGQYSVAITYERRALFARAEVVVRGDYFYDDANTQGQDAYSISNFRGGVRGTSPLRRGVDSQRLRHALHSGRVRVSGARAVGVRRRNGRAADVRDSRGRHVLRAASQTAVRTFRSASSGRPDQPHAPTTLCELRRASRRSASREGGQGYGVSAASFSRRR